MREYEAMLVLDPGLDDAGVNEVLERIRQVISQEGGEVILAGQLANRKGQVAEVTDGWQPRKLAYPIAGRTEGYYAVLRFLGQPTLPAELERQWRPNESVLRYLILRAEEAETRLAPEGE